MLNEKQGCATGGQHIGILREGSGSHIDQPLIHEFTGGCATIDDHGDGFCHILETIKLKLDESFAFGYVHSSQGQLRKYPEGSLRACCQLCKIDSFIVKNAGNVIAAAVAFGFRQRFCDRFVVTIKDSLHPLCNISNRPTAFGIDIIGKFHNGAIGEDHLDGFDIFGDVTVFERMRSCGVICNDAGDGRPVAAGWVRADLLTVGSQISVEVIQDYAGLTCDRLSVVAYPYDAFHIAGSIDDNAGAKRLTCQTGSSPSADYGEIGLAGIFYYRCDIGGVAYGYDASRNDLVDAGVGTESDPVKNINQHIAFDEFA